MTEFLENAKSELKRVDHLIYVSLKYTRTVDVFRSIIERMINCFDFIIEGLLEIEKQKKNIESIPVSPSLRCEKVRKIYAKDEKINDCINFYLFLRKLIISKYTKRTEYRRHVTMTATFESGETHEVTIDAVHEYYDKIKDFVSYVESAVVKGKEE